MLNIDEVVFLSVVAVVAVVAVVIAVDFVILNNENDDVVVNNHDEAIVFFVILVIVTVADSVCVVDVEYQKKLKCSVSLLKYYCLRKNFKNCVRFKFQLSGKKSKKKFARHKIRSDSPDKDVFAFDLEDPGETQV